MQGGWAVRTCSLIAVRSPNTTYPPIRPPMKVSRLRSFPPFARRWMSTSAL